MKSYGSIAMIVATLVMASGCSIVFPEAREALRNPDQLQPRHVAIGDTVVLVRFADTPDEQARGLAGVTELADNEGMLFWFNNRDVRNFWMRGMLIPIDIIWIEGNEVVGVEHAVPPPKPSTSVEDLPNYDSPKPVDIVLEVRAGFARDHGVEVGDFVEYR